MASKSNPRFSPEEAIELIRDMVDRFAPMRERMAWRMQHRFADVAVDAPLPEQYGNVTKFQSNLVRQAGQKLKARLDENPYTVRVEPPEDTDHWQDVSEAIEIAHMANIVDAEERAQYRMQSALADGQVFLGFGVLHWCMAEDALPSMPEPEYRDTLPAGKRDASRYTPLYRDEDEDEEAESDFAYRTTDGGMEFDGDGYPRMRKLSRYRETDESVMERYRRACADAGSPWIEEVLPPDSVAFVPDRSALNGMGRVLVVRECLLLDYVEQRRRQEERYKFATSVQAVDKTIPIGDEFGAPKWWEPSYNANSQTSTRVRVYQLWTREECYEFQGPGDGDLLTVDELTYVDCWRHPYGMPPFAFAWGNINESTHDPVRRYEPPIEGLYNLKPMYDRLVTYLNALAEATATPFYYWESESTGEPLNDARGTPKLFSKNAIAAQVAPPGYKLAVLPDRMNPEIVKITELIKSEFEAAAPASGDAEVTASTQPWAIRLQQAQANVEMKPILGRLASALQLKERNKLFVESLDADEGGFGEPLRTRKGGKVKEIPQEDLRDCVSKLSVEIRGRTEAEQITMEAHGREILLSGRAAGINLLTRADYLENYRGVPNPQEAELELETEWVFDQYIKSQKVAQVLAAHGLLDMLAGPNGAAVGMGGQQVPPEQVMAQNGWEQLPVPGMGMGQGPMPQQFQPGPQMQPPTQMPDLSGVQAPGTMPLAGMPG